MARPKGARNKRTMEVIARAETLGVSPLDVMLENMVHARSMAAIAEEPVEPLLGEDQAATAARVEKQTALSLAYRDRAQMAARDAAPYIHARLTQVALANKPGETLKVENKISIEADARVAEILKGMG
jgi:hypothetical protein